MLRAVFLLGFAAIASSCLWSFDADRLDGAPGPTDAPRPGCVDDLGTAQPGLDAAACGVGGERCQACGGALSVCRAGRCGPEHPPASIALGGEVSCAIEEGGTLWCWGVDRGDSLGGLTSGSSATPIVIPLPEPAVQVSIGGTHFMSLCARLASGRLACWGMNDEAQLGIGVRGGTVFPPQIIADGPFSDLSAGANFGLAVQAGQLVVWGTGAHGETAQGLVDYTLIPTMLDAGSTWAAVHGTETHACGLRDMVDGLGSAFCWGTNDHGELGTGAIGAPSTRPEPPLAASGYRAITTGADHTCAIRGAGRLYCWGRGAGGRLGTGDEADRFEPTEVASDLSPFVAVTAGYLHTCALTAAGAVHCFGVNENGQIGLAAGAMSLVPVHVLDDVRALDAGSTHTCALTNPGRIYCWGRNGDEECGAPMPASALPEPHEVVLGRDAL